MLSKRQKNCITVHRLQQNFDSLAKVSSACASVVRPTKGRLTWTPTRSLTHTATTQVRQTGVKIEPLFNHLAVKPTQPINSSCIFKAPSPTLPNSTAKISSSQKQKTNSPPSQTLSISQKKRLRKKNVVLNHRYLTLSYAPKLRLLAQTAIVLGPHRPSLHVTVSSHRNLTSRKSLIHYNQNLGFHPYI